MNIALIAFTARGLDLARRIAEGLAAGGEQARVSRCFGDGDGRVQLEPWTAENFASADVLVFVGAAGIATRAIAPHVESKVHDPAVIVLDERGAWCVPILSGHVGGANDMARRISEMVGAMPVITTATDISGVFAVDSWAVSRGLEIANPELIKGVSGALLAGRTVTLSSEEPVSGALPGGMDLLPAGDKNADVYIGIATDARGLRLVPKCLTLGIGCRKGVPASAIDEASANFLSRMHVDRRALALVASIDLKAGESGIIDFAKKCGVPFVTYSAEALAQLEGDFSASGFVAEVTGVDNVCERAVVASGADMLVGKTVFDGITLALGMRPWTVSFDGGRA